MQKQHKPFFLFAPVAFLTHKCVFSTADCILTTDSWGMEIHILSHPDDRLLKILDFLENNDYITLRKFGRFHSGKREEFPVTFLNHIYHIN